jgi:hypothetical protein
MASKNQKRFSTSGSVQVKDHDLWADSPHSNGAGVMVSENREHVHFSLLQNGRQKRPTKSVRVSSMVAGIDDEGENDTISEDRASLISVVVKNRMASSLQLMCSRRRFPKGRGVLLVFIILCIYALLKRFHLSVH